MCRLITLRAQLSIVTSIFGPCLFGKRAFELKSGNFTVYKRFSSHFLLQPPGWHHKARMVGRGKLLNETKGERWFDSGWNAKTIRMKTWRFMSEVVSLAFLWVFSKTYRGNLDEFSLLKNAMGAIFCRLTLRISQAFLSVRNRKITGLQAQR